jgi:ceramide glucosyltransferase
MSFATLVRLSSARRLAHGTTPISILKPVRGLDDELETNLESFCRQTHGQYELIVGAADADDPALSIAERVRRRFPQVDFRIVSGQWPTGYNPKVRNLRKLLALARYSTVLVSDGDIRVHPDYLSVMAGAIEQPKVGLVSNVVIGTGAQTVGAACENLRLNGFVASSIAAAELIARHPVVIGKSMLFSRDALNAAGGFEVAADVLAEDYLLGRAVLRAGYRVSTIGFPVWAINRHWSVTKMLQRHTRWSQIRRHVSPATFLFEPLALPELWLVLVLALGPRQPQTAITTTALAAVLISIMLQLATTIRLQWPSVGWKNLILLPLSSTLGLIAWLRAWSMDTVVWRNQTYRIASGSRLFPVHARQVSPTGSARVQEAA